jgi:predicted aspartyl protease
MSTLVLGKLLLTATVVAAAASLPPSVYGAEASRLTAKEMASFASLADPAEQRLFASPTRRDSIGRIVAPVIINGEGPFRFVVDTGATHSVMSAALAQRLNLSAVPQGDVILSGVTGSASVATVQVDRLQAGDLLLHNRRMPVMDALLGGADGVLGMQGLEDKRIVVDFRRGRIEILESRGSRVRSGYVSVPVEVAFNQLLLVDAYIGGIRVKAIIDTGAERTLGNRALHDALGVASGFFYSPRTTGVQGVTAQIQNGDMALAPRIRIGALQLNQVGVTFGDMYVFEVWGFREQPALLLGMDVLGVLDSLVIDYGRKQIQFRPRSNVIRTGSRLAR